MQEVFETLAVGLTVGWMLIVILGFIAYMRYLRHKERMALGDNGRIHKKGASYE